MTWTGTVTAVVDTGTVGGAFGISARGGSGVASGVALCPLPARATGGVVAAAVPASSMTNSTSPTLQTCPSL